MPPTFALVAFGQQWTRLSACQVGDLVIIAGRISCGKKSQAYKVTVVDLQRLAFEDQQQTEAESTEQPPVQEPAS